MTDQQSLFRWRSRRQGAMGGGNVMDTAVRRNSGMRVPGENHFPPVAGREMNVEPPDCAELLEDAAGRQLSGTLNAHGLGRDVKAVAAGVNIDDHEARRPDNSIRINAI